MGRKHRLRIVKVPVLDTGIGQSLGYRDDRHLIEAGEAKRAEINEMLTPEAAAKLRKVDEDLDRRFLFGD
jgi:hypothetical protein